MAPAVRREPFVNSHSANVAFPIDATCWGVPLQIPFGATTRLLAPPTWQRIGTPAIPAETATSSLGSAVDPRSDDCENPRPASDWMTLAGTSGGITLQLTEGNSGIVPNATKASSRASVIGPTRPSDAIPWAS